MVNMSILHCQDRLEDDTYILELQAKKVFYIQELIERSWYVALISPPRGIKDIEAYEVDAFGGIDFVELEIA